MRRNIRALLLAPMTLGLISAPAQESKHAAQPNAQAKTAQPQSVASIDAPDFELPAIDGKSIRLADYRGKTVLLNFWATWCVPCKLEMPWFMEFQKKYGSQGLVILGIAIDDPAAVQKFAEKLGVNYTLLLGTRAVFDAYSNVGMLGLPTTFYIGPQGKVLIQSSGIVSRSEIESEIKFVLAKSSAASDRISKNSHLPPYGQP